VIVFGGRGAPNGLGEDLVQRQFHVRVIGQVVVLLGHRGQDRGLLIDFVIRVRFVIGLLDGDVIEIGDDVNVNVNVVADIDDVDFLAQDLFVEALGEFLLVKYFVVFAINTHGFPSL